MKPKQLTRHEKMAAVKVIGQRMRQAREMCNMSQSEAAKRLGYANPSKLSKVEGATDTKSIPLWLLLDASSLYDVSMDYLCGMSGDWEVTDSMACEREVSAWARSALEGLRVQELQLLKKLHEKMEFTMGVVHSMLDTSDGAQEALRRFAELNPEFMDMRGGARLVAAVDHLNGVACEAAGRLKRFRIEFGKRAALPPRQMPLVISEVA